MERAITSDMLTLSSIHCRRIFSLYIGGNVFHRLDGQHQAVMSSRHEETYCEFLLGNNYRPKPFSSFDSKRLAFLGPTTSKNAFSLYIEPYFLWWIIRKGI